MSRSGRDGGEDERQNEGEDERQNEGEDRDAEPTRPQPPEPPDAPFLVQFVSLHRQVWTAYLAAFFPGRLFGPVTPGAGWRLPMAPFYVFFTALALLLAFTEASPEPRWSAAARAIPYDRLPPEMTATFFEDLGVSAEDFRLASEGAPPGGASERWEVIEREVIALHGGPSAEAVAASMAAAGALVSADLLRRGASTVNQVAFVARHYGALLALTGLFAVAAAFRLAAAGVKGSGMTRAEIFNRAGYYAGLCAAMSCAAAAARMGGGLGPATLTVQLVQLMLVLTHLPVLFMVAGGLSFLRALNGSVLSLLLFWALAVGALWLGANAGP